jgi:hypothetical protein
MSEPAPRSSWRAVLARRIGPRSIQDYLVEEANLRGFWGAYGNAQVARPVDAGLEHEDIIVGLLAPQAPIEGRILKLVLRMCQSGKLDAQRVAFRTRRERADRALHWLLAHVPPGEDTPPVRAIREALRPPRGAQPPAYDYDFSRLVRRPAKGASWQTVPRRS